MKQQAGGREIPELAGATPRERAAFRARLEPGSRLRRRGDRAPCRAALEPLKERSHDFQTERYEIRRAIDTLDHVALPRGLHLPVQIAIRAVERILDMGLDFGR